MPSTISVSCVGIAPLIKAPPPFGCDLPPQVCRKVRELVLLVVNIGTHVFLQYGFDVSEGRQIKCFVDVSHLPDRVCLRFSQCELTLRASKAARLSPYFRRTREFVKRIGSFFGEMLGPDVGELACDFKSSHVKRLSERDLHCLARERCSAQSKRNSIVARSSHSGSFGFLAT